MISFHRGPTIGRESKNTYFADHTHDDDSLKGNVTRVSWGGGGCRKTSWETPQSHLLVGKWKAKSWLNRSTRTVTFYFTNKRFTGRVEGTGGSNYWAGLSLFAL